MNKVLLGLLVALGLAIMTAGASAAPPGVIGGEPASFAAWPWQVAILSAYNRDPYLAQFCGGTLIAPNVVLTAAHCLYDRHGYRLDADDVDVLSGTSLLNARFGDRSSVVGASVSDLSDDMWNPDDLGILWVEHTSPLATPLPPATFAQAAAFGVGSRVTVAGWGVNRIREDRGYFPRKLKQYTATVRSKSHGFLFIRSMTATGCYGDSGGPAVGRDAAGAPYLVGVVHAGLSRCPTGQSMMVVNVAAQQQRIQQAVATGPHPDDEARPDDSAAPAPSLPTGG